MSRFLEIFTGSANTKPIKSISEQPFRFGGPEFDAGRDNNERSSDLFEKGKYSMHKRMNLPCASPNSLNQL
jgi:hypothetical protein